MTDKALLPQGQNSTGICPDCRASINVGPGAAHVCFTSSQRKNSSDTQDIEHVTSTDYQRIDN